MTLPDFITPKLIRDFSRKANVTEEVFEESLVDYVTTQRITIDSRYVKDFLNRHVEYLKKSPPRVIWSYDASTHQDLAHKVVSYLKGLKTKDEYGHTYGKTVTGLEIDRIPDEQAITHALIKGWVNREDFKIICLYWRKTKPKSFVLFRYENQWKEEVMWCKNGL